MSKHKQRVVLAVPGGREGQGGIVRQMCYVVQAAEGREDGPVFAWLATRSDNAFWPVVYAWCVLRLLWLCLLGRVDILHVNLASKGSFFRKYLLFRLAKLFKVKCVVHLHGGGFEGFYGNASAILKRHIVYMLTQAEAMVVLGKRWQEFALRLGVKEEKLHLLPNAVPTPPKVSAGDSENPHIIFLGHLLERKGVGELIEALARLENLPWRVTIAGSGEIEHYREQAMQVGLQERIAFPGWLGEREVEKLYQNADILVLPSHIENQPLCVLEAMAHGLAIVVTEVGTVAEIVTHEVTGVIVPPKDVALLQHELERLITDKVLRKSLASAARKSHEDSFSLPKYYGALSIIYSNL